MDLYRDTRIDRHLSFPNHCSRAY